ncbi:MAG: hypothetical protein H8E03_01500 [Pelagibacteraceae bacterium]|nr:hypothetical protein [Pelagibacteraceae bacterium]
MAGYSKTAERQNQALQDIIHGRTPEKRIFVGGIDKEFKKKFTEKEQKERSENEDRTEALKEARMPWFCPECDQVMKTRLDRKFYYMQQRCHDCVVKEETSHRINGTFDEYEQKKISENKKAYIRDLKQSITEWKNSPDTVTFLNQVNPDGHTVTKEKWDVDKKVLQQTIEDAEKYLEKLEETI